MQLLRNTAPALAMVLAACASSGARTAPRERNVISAEEIATLTVMDAYEVVEKLRPEFLRARGVGSLRSRQPDLPVVYVDGVRVGGLNELRRVPRTLLAEIGYLHAADATTRYGIDHVGGAILVLTNRR